MLGFFSGFEAVKLLLVLTSLSFMTWLAVDDVNVKLILGLTTIFMQQLFYALLCSDTDKYE